MLSLIFKKFAALICPLIFGWFIGLAFFVNQIPKDITDTSTKTDAIIVLTGGGGRVAAGVRLLLAGFAKKMLISGVGKDTKLHELDEINEVLPGKVTSGKISALSSAITLGYVALNTKSNALEARDWIKANNFQSIRLVTSSYHMPRSMVEFEKIMPEIKIIPNPVFSNKVKMSEWWKSPGTAKLVIYEYNKYLRTKL